MKTKLSLTLLFFIGINSFAQNIQFSDNNFKQGLLNHGGLINGTGISTIDSNNDGEISYNEALLYNGTIRLNYLSISNLNGIQHFRNITVLECAYNNLTSLNVSRNTQLKTLICSGNNLTQLQVSNHILLKKLNFSYNQVTNFYAPVSLESLSSAHNSLNSLNISNAHQLKHVYARDNNLTHLNLSNNSNLEILDISKNKLPNIQVLNIPELNNLNVSNNDLTNINLTNNVKLNYLNISNNQISNVDASMNISLIELIATNNQIVSLDVSNNLNLQNLAVINNKIEKLDLSKNTSLRQIYCTGNNLKSLNIANGNNQNSSYYTMYAHNNENLKCIKIDPNFVPSTYIYWWRKDTTATYSDSCPLKLDTTPDDLSPFAKNTFNLNNDNYGSNNLKAYPNPSNDIIHIQSKEKVKKLSLYNLNGQLIKEQEHTNQLVISDIEKGTYFLIINVNGMETSKQILKK